MLEFTTKSGVECVINCADLKDARELRTTILKELQEAGIKLPENQTIDLKEIKAALTGQKIPTDLLNSIKDIFTVVDTSDKIYKIVFKCLKRCSYDSEMITEATFEAEEARADYYEVFTKCIVENILPFVKNLLSALPKA